MHRSGKGLSGVTPVHQHVLHLTEAVSAPVARARSVIKGPGLVRILPAFPPLFPGEQARGQYGQLVTDPADQLSTFDLREVASILEDEHCITSDSAVVNIRPAVVYQITDPQKLVLNVQNHLEALRTAITATLRAVVGSMTLTDAITGREAIATQMRARLAEQADRWGISMISVEIQDIKPEASVERAMNERRAAEENAERDRFELVVRAQARLQGAEADNQASIARADAEKLATITKAEAQKLAAITIAEGEKEAEIHRSEGVASLYKVLMGLGAGAGNCSDLRGSADYSAYCGGATEHGISTANRFRPLKREQLQALTSH